MKVFIVTCERTIGFDGYYGAFTETTVLATFAYKSQAQRFIKTIQNTQDCEFHIVEQVVLGYNTGE